MYGSLVYSYVYPNGRCNVREKYLETQAPFEYPLVYGYPQTVLIFTDKRESFVAVVVLFIQFDAS